MSHPRRAPRSLALLCAWSALLALALAASSPRAARAAGGPGPDCSTVFVSTSTKNALGSKLVSPEVRRALSAIFMKYALREVTSKVGADLTLTLGAEASARKATSRIGTYYYPQLNAFAELQGRFGGEKYEAKRTYSGAQNKLDAGAAASDALALWPGSSKAFVESAVAPLFAQAIPALANGVTIVSDPPGATIAFEDAAIRRASAGEGTPRTPKAFGCFPLGTELHVLLTLTDHEPERATLTADAAAVPTPVTLRRRPSATSSSSSSGGPRPDDGTQDPSPWRWVLGVLGALAVLGAVATLFYLRAKKPARAPEPPSQAPAPTPSDVEGRAELRRLLEYAIKSDADLSAFCFDYFDKEVYRDFSDGMERSHKITILMRDVPHVEIRKRLAERFPDEVAAFERGEGGSP